MLKFFKRSFLILFAIFFCLASLVVFLEFCEQYKTGKMQNETIPRIKYTITDINLFFPANDFQKRRRYILWNYRGYAKQLDKLKSLKDGYVVSAEDFENKDPNNPFSDWNRIYNSKGYRNLFYLLIYGKLSDTQKQAIIDFYKIKDNASYYIAKEICKIKNPQSMEEFAEIQAYISEINYNVGFPEWWLMSISEHRSYRESRGETFLKAKAERDRNHLEIEVNNGNLNNKIIN